MKCADGPSKQEDCPIGQMYIPPEDLPEAIENNCCGKCVPSPCETKENFVNITVESKSKLEKILKTFSISWNKIWIFSVSAPPPPHTA